MGTVGSSVGGPLRGVRIGVVSREVYAGLLAQVAQIQDRVLTSVATSLFGLGLEDQSGGEGVPQGMFENLRRFFTTCVPSSTLWNQDLLEKLSS